MSVDSIFCTAHRVKRLNEKIPADVSQQGLF
ncbi:MAG: hypothetical protein ACJAT7_003041, partial [Psychromonas sp.]